MLGPMIGAQEMSMNEKVLREFAVRKRLSSLWGVPLYRIDVDVRSENVQVTLDGESPSPEQMTLFENDIRDRTAEARRRMN